jgi:hypothetical protein
MSHSCVGNPVNVQRRRGMKLPDRWGELLEGGFLSKVLPVPQALPY